MTLLILLFEYAYGLQAIIKSARPLLLGHGVPPALLKELEENAQRELEEAKVACYTKMVVVTARKKHPNPS